MALPGLRSRCDLRPDAVWKPKRILRAIDGLLTIERFKEALLVANFRLSFKDCGQLAGRRRPNLKFVG